MGIMVGAFSGCKTKRAPGARVLTRKANSIVVVMIFPVIRLPSLGLAGGFGVKTLPEPDNLSLISRIDTIKGEK